MLILNRASLRDARAKWLASLGAVLACILILTVTAHWLSFKLLHLLLPKDRTALYFVPLVTLIAGILAALPARARLGKAGRVALIAALYALSGYYLLCLRLSYFKEWRFDADVKDAYSVLAYYNHTFGIKDVATNWMYAPSLNFYRTFSGRETFGEFHWVNPYPPDRMIYVLSGPFDGGFIAEQKLKVVYRGDISDVVVAIRPELESRPLTKGY